jgi:hypothetical protein
LIDYYHLKKDLSIPYFSIYRSNDIFLILSGVGMLSAASAVSFLYGKRRQKPRCWINIGIAGHGSAPLGTFFLAHTLLCQGSPKKYYPCFLTKPNVPMAILETVFTPKSTDLEKDYLYDMEAYGFMGAASRFSPLERAHVLKIVSDNGYQKGLKEEEVSSLIGLAIPHLDQFLASIPALYEPEDPPFFEECLKRWRGTHHQTEYLKQLLRKRQALSQIVPLDFLELSSFDSLNEILLFIEKELTYKPPLYVSSNLH